MEQEAKPGFFKKLGHGLKDFFDPKEWLKTLREVPGLVLALITVSMILMNVLANKAILELPIPNTDVYWLIQDAGVTLSWVGFLAGDLPGTEWSQEGSSHKTHVARCPSRRFLR